MFARLRSDVACILERDPAARSTWEVLTCYPGLHAIYIHKLARWFWLRGLKWFGRFTSHLGRWLTGIEIHPGAKIGRRLFIDHGMGVVIGETAEIGDDVTLYQGVTLGGTSLARAKRHPTLGNRVIVGSGAQVLGPFTVGEGARIGANAVVVNEVPPGVTMVGIPARAVQRGQGQQSETFCAYGLSGHELPDPVARAMNGLLDELTTLKARVAELEAQQSLPRPPTDDDSPTVAAAE